MAKYPTERHFSVINSELVQEIQPERDHSHQDKRMKECCIGDTGFEPGLRV